jgi:hypothetical protein
MEEEEEDDEEEEEEKGRAEGKKESLVRRGGVRDAEKNEEGR